MRYLSVLALSLAVLGGAPAALAQPAATTPLTQHTGDPIAYRIGLPEGWIVEREGEMLSAETEQAIAVFVVGDLMDELEPDSRLPVSEAEQRRILTGMFLGSDSLLMGLMQQMVESFQEDGTALQDVRRELRTLGGEKAGFLAGRGEGMLEGAPARMEALFTIRDGVMYLLVVSAREDVFAEHEPIFARIRDSVVLSPTPPPASAEGSR